MEASCKDNRSAAFGLRDFPRTLPEFRGYHAGETVLVCGCGASLSQLDAPARCVTIGVNDVGRLFDPDYLVVLNPRYQFTEDRFRYVEQSRARVVFSQLDLGISHPHQVVFRLGRRSGTDLSDSESLPYTRNSPYVALCLAAFMGARRIGLIGVDFTDHHFFAQTGRHVLDSDFAQIDREYAQLYQSLAAQGIEIFNLSEQSRLTAIPKTAARSFFGGGNAQAEFAGRGVFCVNYRFLSCGSVFADGLAHAADEMGLRWQSAYWDDPGLEEAIRAFEPELLFVVHGRKFSGRRASLARHYRSAVWLLDEPYEVDDTSRFSGNFDTVFVNDPGTLSRHRNAHYLPVCYDPLVHTYRAGEERPYGAGFIGGANPRREEALARLARRGLLSYTVGGPWHDAEVSRVCLSGNIPAGETAQLYRRTEIVLNLFRTKHHYNAAHIPAVSMNPRNYEALACGALVISEHRPELETVFPELPTFRSLEEMEAMVEQYRQDPALARKARDASIRRLATHTYAHRLSSALAVALDPTENSMPRTLQLPPTLRMPAPAPPFEPAEFPFRLADDWEIDAECVHRDPDSGVMLRKTPEAAAGSERGLVGKTRHGDILLEFEMLLQPDTHFIAKIHQVEAHDQLTNSFHLMCHGARAYLARHNHVMRRIGVPVGRWTSVSCSYRDGVVELRIDGAEMARAADRTLESGYCFLGVKGGAARLRNISVAIPGARPSEPEKEYELLRPRGGALHPAVSIVTTVYDRLDCLERCIRSVQALNFRDYEQIIVADAPPAGVVRHIAQLGHQYDPEARQITMATLKARRNDWGITPASVGVGLARGKYLCFLSDDNGYVPSHFDRLVATIESDPSLGFAYSSCLYDGRLILNAPAPRPGRIDLGQPLFRRELFDRHLGGGLPFHEFGWDWRMIERFIRSGVRWKHLNEATFIFRLAKYPHLMAGRSASVTV